MMEAKPRLRTPEVLADFLGVPVGWVYKRTRSAAEAATEALAREIWGNCDLTVTESSTQVN
ncbi:MAG TPA: hypothetical protein VNO70_07930 [Blastocatellia bacterium]|nr:hypothetical protein [Blastocatellia bacterium]